jgi:hypothetical protein
MAPETKRTMSGFPQRHGGTRQQRNEFVHVGRRHVLLERNGLPLPPQTFACERARDDLPRRDLLGHRPAGKRSDAEAGLHHFDNRFRQRNVDTRAGVTPAGRKIFSNSVLSSGLTYRIKF